MLERMPSQQLHSDDVLTVCFFNLMNHADVGMIERRGSESLPLKAGQPFGIVRKHFRKDLDGYIAPELGVVRLIHLTHPARANLREDFV